MQWKALNQQTIKQTNLKKVFSLIAKQMPVSRIALSQMTALSKTTISALVDELIASGYVVDEGAVDTGRQGRKPNALCLNYQENLVAVINWHIDDLELSLVNLTGDVVFYRLLPLGVRLDFAQIIREAYENVLLVAAGQRRVLGFCLVVPSMIEPETRRMISTVLPVPVTSNVLDDLCALFADVPVAVFNDTACYAYAEHTLTTLGFDTFTFININKGVGAVFVSQGEMLRGEGGMRAQVGHYSLDRNGDPCVCGNVGCLENEIGESALEKRARREGVFQLLTQSHPLTFDTLGRLADAGDETACRFVDGLAADLAWAIGNIATVYNTSRIIIGGRGKKLGSYYLRQLDRRIHEKGFQVFVAGIQTQYTALEDDAIMRGAAKYFLDKYFVLFEEMKGFVVLE